MNFQRAPVSFDPQYFKKLSKQGVHKSTEEIFTSIYKTNHWSGSTSISGNGSDLLQTEEIQKQLPTLIRELNIKVILDLPCGDFNWMSKIYLPTEKYIGADIVEALIIHNKMKYGNEIRKFEVLNLINDPLPSADLIFCRDCLVHFSYDDIKKAFKNIRNSDIKYILTTTFADCKMNEDITTGDWRILNLKLPPFSLPKPIRIINEKCSEGNGSYADKSLGLWYVTDLKIFEQ